MIVAAHQPHFLPWLGYLDRMARADRFVIVDHVQFERRNFQNRTMIRLGEHAKWLSVPVQQHSQKERIIEKLICNAEEGSTRAWGPAMFQTIRYAYREAPFFAKYSSQLREILETPWQKLADLDQATLDFLREAYGITTPLVRSADLAPEGQRSEMLLDLCRKVGATTYLGGMGGSRTYLDTAIFTAEGIDVAWHEFEHPRYHQCGPKPFIPGLSAIDLLFNVGEECRRYIGPEAQERRIAA